MAWSTAALDHTLEWTVIVWLTYARAPGSMVRSRESRDLINEPNLQDD